MGGFADVDDAARDLAAEFGVAEERAVERRRCLLARIVGVCANLLDDDRSLDTEMLGEQHGLEHD